MRNIQDGSGPNVEAARARKADALTAFLRRHWGHQAGDLAARMDAKQWALVAACAGVHVPSDITRALILRLLGSTPRGRQCKHLRFDF